KPPRDIDALAEGLMRLSQLVVEHPEIEELDINPVIAFEKGKGYKAVDARIVLRKPKTESV
ncbi:MAG: acetate--CoA ligase family protein, partial [Nitrososphaerota archaeon]